MKKRRKRMEGKSRLSSMKVSGVEDWTENKTKMEKEEKKKERKE